MKLDDLSKMPFGKHAGKPMQDVPASYLHWLWTKEDFDKKSPVGVYISENIEALKLDYKDGIWT